MARKRPRRRENQRRTIRQRTSRTAHWLRPRLERLETRQLLSITPNVTLTGLNGPTAMAFNSSGDLFVANSGFTQQGTTVSEFAPGSTTPFATLVGLADPDALAFDHSGNLYVANYQQTGSISVFAPDSTTPTATLSGIRWPKDLLFNSAGDLFVADDAAISPSVTEFTPGSTTASFAIDPSGHFGQALAFDSGGNLYEGDDLNDNIEEFASGATTSFTQLTGVTNPNALAFDSSGILYSVNGIGSGTVSEFSVGSTAPNVTLTGLVTPTAIAFDANRDIFVTSSQGQTVSEFLPASKSSATTAAVTLSGLDDPQDLVFDSSGNLFVSNDGGNTVSEFELGTQVTSPPVVTTSSGALNYTLGSGAQAVDTGVSLTDSESSQISSATVAISSGFDSGADTLAFTTQNGISANFNSTSGALVLSGASTVANYITALRSITFSTTVTNLSAGSTRTVSFLVNDGINSSNLATRSIDLVSLTAAKLVVTSQPPSTIGAGSGFGLIVEAETNSGSVATGSSGGVTVALANNPGSASLSGTLTATVSDGMATFSGLSLNKVGSGYTLNVTSGTLTSANTSAIAVSAGAATQFVISSQPPSNVTAGAGFGLTVTAEDAEGDVVAGFTGAATVALLANPGSSTLAGTLTASATAGVATFSGLSLNKVGGGYTLAVSSNGLTAATSSAISVTPGAAAQLVIATQPPASVTAGSGFGLTLVAEDAEGNMATGFAGSVTAALLANPGSSTLGGTTTAAAAGGAVVFSSLTLNKAVSGYTLNLASSGLTSATSGSFTVIPGAPSQLVLLGGFPANVTVDAHFGFTAEAEDAEGNLTTDYSATVAVALSANPGSSSLSGATTVATSSGMAVFSGLFLNVTGAAYQLSVTSGSLTAATVGPFNVTARGVATHLAFETSPPSTLAPGAPFGLTVEAEDDFGVVDISYDSGVSLALSNNPGASTLSGTITAAASAGVATFSSLSLNNPGANYTLQANSGDLTPGTTSPFNVIGTLAINGASASNAVQIAFSDADDFTVTINGGTPASYSTSVAPKLVYNAPAGIFSEVVFDDPYNTYTATQSFTSTDAVSKGFEFDANNVVNLYVYAGNGASTATVSVGTGTEANFYVGDAASNYSYIGDPALGLYSELSGFASEAITGSGSTTYAYVYSTSHGTFVGDPGGSTYMATGTSLTLDNFPQVYAVGAADGTDSMTLHTAGGSFVGQPSFSYVSGKFSGSSFEIGAVFAANVTAQATNATDQAFFYSYGNDTFNGAQGTSSLTGSATGFASFATFASQTTGFQSVSVLESGSGTDVANLTSPGNGTFTETASASTLSVAGVTVVTVNTFFSNNGTLAAVPSKVNITGNANGSDTANLYDAAGTNALVAQGNKATLTTPVNTVGVTQFGKVNAFRQNGASDTVHQQSVDFALQTVGNWTSN